MKYLRSIGISIMLLSPMLTFAQEGGIAGNVQCEGFGCNFGHLLGLIQNIILFLFALSIPIAAIALAVAGFKILTAGSDTGARNDAKEMIIKIIKGVIIMLIAGLIVSTIVNALLDQEFIFSGL